MSDEDFGIFTYPVSDGDQTPHCDSLVLHAPGACVYCDQRKDLQDQRITSGTNFTGEHDPLKNPCPAEVRRDLKRIERWPGNVPNPSGGSWLENIS